MNVILQSMSDRDYADWLEIIIPEYAAEKVANGTWSPDEALAKARESMDSLLKDGRNTKGHYLFSIRLKSEDQRMGFLWYAFHEGKAFVYDLYIAPEYRRRGYAFQAMKRLEIDAANRGFTSIGLHVFGQNRGAQALYQKLGYDITDLTMAKKIPTTR